MADPDLAQDVAEARKATALGLLAAIAERDRTAAADCLADDVTWWVPQSTVDQGVGRPLRGRRAVLGLICGESRYQVGTMAWEHHHTLHDNGIVAVHSTLRATTKAGRSYENHYALLYRFDGSLIVEGWEHTDTAYAFSRFAG